MTELIDRLSEDARKKAEKKRMPDWMDPMLAKLTHDFFSSEGWIFERKLDGERILAYISYKGDVTLYSRNQKELTDNYPEIQDALMKHAAKGCILDGEIVAFDENEVSDFRKLQQRMHVSSREEALDSDVEVYYYLFDLLYVDGHIITKCALRDRKKLLSVAVEAIDPLRMVKYHNHDGVKLYKKACENGWEGLIAKQAESPYLHSRSNKWLKFKCINQQEFVIGGYTEPHGERVGLGALLLGYYRDNDLVYAGKVGAGFDDQTLKALREKLEGINRDTSPFNQGDPETKAVQFVSPELVCEVAFTEWTEEDRLRHPSYKGLRRDKSPRDVHQEEQNRVAELDEEDS